ncbi:hypothetical protein IQ268_16650 [Oculatella sp. LEGE 06141]|uniref:hypothetical protein n=1 Tax=Oculatella sp. LEGE 06141 TaxID=1828648 RepID=UPI00187EED61|nr:hypothetical protein [Oculatella sp. LEGE 06141]MBE9180194.1 hypothetical protein [Oculatella sp. LEGE 06141]
MNDQPQTSIFRKESLERLSSPEQLDQLMQVVSPKSWLPLASLGSMVVLTLLWGVLGRIPVTATGQGVLVQSSSSSNELVGLSRFESREGKWIQPGMEVILLPNSADSTGGIVAHVQSVSEPSITTLESARQLGTLDENRSIEVIIKLERDPATASGYKWTSLSGARLALSPGTTAIARITLQEKAPIAFVFPFLEASQ